jgi:hypothetical protein
MRSGPAKGSLCVAVRSAAEGAAAAGVPSRRCAVRLGHHTNQLDWWVRERQEWWAGYAVQMAGNGGSRLWIFVP